MSAPPVDPGLQPERTELAWRRTALTLAVGSLVSMRLLPDAFGHIAWVLPGVVGLVATAWIWRAARRRYDRVSAATRAEYPRSVLPDGGLLAATALFVALGGVAALAIAVLHT